MTRSRTQPPRRPDANGDEARQRLENGGYTDAELNAALFRSQRSDPLAVAMRLLTLAAVYGLLASAIGDGLPASYLLIPLLAELLLIFWLGWVLSRWFIDCRAFRRSAGSGIGVAIWSGLILAAAMAWVVWDPEAKVLAWSELLPRSEQALHTARGHGIHWALFAMAAGLLLSTWTEVGRWRRSGGVFVWTSITTAGTRLGLLILLGLLVVVAASVLSPLWPGSGLERWLGARARLAWVVWSALLVLDVGVVLVLALMHRELTAKRA